MSVFEHCQDRQKLEQDYGNMNQVFQEHQMRPTPLLCEKPQQRSIQNARAMCVKRTNENQQVKPICQGWECSTSPFTIQPDPYPNTFMNFPTYSSDGYICTNNHRIWNNMTGRKRATCNDIIR